MFILFALGYIIQFEQIWFNLSFDLDLEILQFWMYNTHVVIIFITTCKEEFWSAVKDFHHYLILQLCHHSLWVFLDCVIPVEQIVFSLVDHDCFRKVIGDANLHIADIIVDVSKLPLHVDAFIWLNDIVYNNLFFLADLACHVQLVVIFTLWHNLNVYDLLKFVFVDVMAILALNLGVSVFRVSIIGYKRDQINRL